MRVLLDENLPRGLKQHLAEHEVTTVAEIGWTGASDAELLLQAGDRFDVLLTADRNLEFQQNVSKARVGIVVVEARNTRLETLLPLAPAILRALSRARAGSVLRVAER